MNLFLKIITAIAFVPTFLATAVGAIDRRVSLSIWFIWFGLLIGVVGLASSLWKRKTL